MNVFELGVFVVMVGAVVLCSRELGRLVEMPDALWVPLVIAVFVLLLRLFTRIRHRALLYLSFLVGAASLLSMGLAEVLAARDSVFVVLVSAGLTLIVVRGALLVKRRPR